MSVLTIEPLASEKVFASLSDDASWQPNVAFMDSSRGWNRHYYAGANTGDESPYGAIFSSYQTQNLSPELEARLFELCLLKNGWDGGNALQINSKAVEAARNALRQLRLTRAFQAPGMVPTFDGFLQLEWHNVLRSLEFEYTLEGWSILGVTEVAAEHPIYNTALVPLIAMKDLVKFYDWFSTGESVWPSR